jgi:hypothetical protein
MFKVIRMTSENATKYEPSAHTLERMARQHVVETLKGEVHMSFIVDTNHHNGLEVHTVLTSGVVVIGNLKGKRLITWLIARPNQLKRYGIGNKDIITKSIQNTRMGLNQI